MMDFNMKGQQQQKRSFFFLIKKKKKEKKKGKRDQNWEKEQKSPNRLSEKTFAHTHTELYSLMSLTHCLLKYR